MVPECGDAPGVGDRLLTSKIRIRNKVEQFRVFKVLHVELESLRSKSETLPKVERLVVKFTITT